jgi:hypothetical protein
MPRDYIKPEIKIGNYILKWDISSSGIAQKEVSELRRFVTDLAPYLSAAVYTAARGVQRHIKEKAVSKKEVRGFEEMFSPRLLLSRKIRNNHIVYALEMTGDGATIISRQETIVSVGVKGKLILSWNLGELVFDRQRG